MAEAFDLQDIRAIIVAGTYRDLSKAAAALGWTKSKLVKCLREFETSLGVAIFQWSTERVWPTQEGGVFVANASEVLQILEACAVAIDVSAECAEQYFSLPIQPQRPSSV